MKQTLVSSLLLSLAAPALAMVSSSASLTGLRYELVDLDPDDGVTPYVRFTGVSQARAMFGPRCFGQCDEQAGSFTVPASAYRSWGEVNSASAAVSPDGLFASGHWDPSDGPRSNRPEYHALARYRGVLGSPLFVVSANTGLRITGQYTLEAHVDPFRKPHPMYRGPESARAHLFFYSRFIDGPAFWDEVRATSDWQSEPDHAHASGEMSVLLRNELDHQATLWGRWGVQADGAVPSIPEPFTYALMGAGLGLVGWVARRRRDADSRAPG